MNTINEIAKGMKDGSSLKAVLMVNGKEIKVSGIVKNGEWCPQLLVPNGTNIKNQERYISYGPGTKVVRLL
jgi:hypothetical protein